jgi:hypothetical protein
MLHKVSPFKGEPVDCLQWVVPDAVEANDYNPNSVAPPEMELLRHSIAKDGYTQPIVTWRDGRNRTTETAFLRSRRVWGECVGGSKGPSYSAISERYGGTVPHRLSDWIQGSSRKGWHVALARHEEILIHNQDTHLLHPYYRPIVVELCLRYGTRTLINMRSMCDLAQYYAAHPEGFSIILGCINVLKGRSWFERAFRDEEQEKEVLVYRASDVYAGDTPLHREDPFLVYPMTKNLLDRSGRLYYKMFDEIGTRYWYKRRDAQKASWL